MEHLTDDERRAADAERRQRYRGPRKKPYRRRAERLECSIEITVDRDTRELIETAAERAGMTSKLWIRELIVDTLSLDETIRADRRE